MFASNLFAVAEFGHEITLWLLLGLSVVSISFILERWLTFREIKIKASHFNDRIRRLLGKRKVRESDVEGIIDDWDSIEGRALSYGMDHIKENGVDGLEEAFSSYAMTERPQLEKRLNFLATVGSNAPFIGLLGTVFGIMDAFQGLANQGDPSMVMVGISKALVATAIGLVVAIPAVIAYNSFQKQTKRVFQNLESIKNLCVSFGKNSIKTVRG